MGFSVDGLEKIQDPALREVVERFGIVVATRALKRKCAETNTPYPPSRAIAHRYRGHTEEAKQSAKQLAERITGEHDLVPIAKDPEPVWVPRIRSLPKHQSTAVQLAFPF